MVVSGSFRLIQNFFDMNFHNTGGYLPLNNTPFAIPEYSRAYGGEYGELLFA